MATSNKKLKFCPRCLGTEKRTCYMCRYMTLDRPKERKKFLQELWDKGLRFNMKTFGVAKIDAAVLITYGPWSEFTAKYMDYTLTELELEAKIELILKKEKEKEKEKINGL